MGVACMCAPYWGNKFCCVNIGCGTADACANLAKGFCFTGVPFMEDSFILSSASAEVASAGGP